MKPSPDSALVRLQRECVALWLACGDPRTPWQAKALALLVVGYFFSPVDLIPDFIPVIGHLDDLILIPLGVALTLRMIPPDVMAECRLRAREAMGRRVWIAWATAAFIVVLWAVGLIWVIGLWRGMSG